MGLQVGLHTHMHCPESHCRPGCTACRRSKLCCFALRALQICTGLQEKGACCLSLAECNLQQPQSTDTSMAWKS